MPPTQVASQCLLRASLRRTQVASQDLPQDLPPTQVASPTQDMPPTQVASQDLPRELPPTQVAMPPTQVASQDLPRDLPPPQVVASQPPTRVVVSQDLPSHLPSRDLPPTQAMVSWDLPSWGLPSQACRCWTCPRCRWGGPAPISARRPARMGDGPRAVCVPAPGSGSAMRARTTCVGAKYWRWRGKRRRRQRRPKQLRHPSRPTQHPCYSAPITPLRLAATHPRNQHPHTSPTLSPTTHPPPATHPRHKPPTHARRHPLRPTHIPDTTTPLIPSVIPRVPHSIPYYHPLRLHRSDVRDV
jgi:hypothetical protein